MFASTGLLNCGNCQKVDNVSNSIIFNMVRYTEFLSKYFGFFGKCNVIQYKSQRKSIQLGTFMYLVNKGM